MNKLVSLKNNDNINIVYNINNFNSPEHIYIPANCITESVKMNDYIYKNTYFKNYINSISGIISGVSKKQVNKKMMEVLVITNDYQENVLKKQRKKVIKTKEELINLLNKNYLNAILNKINAISNIENLIISSIDEEEYTVKEFIRLSNNYREILETINLLIKVFNLNKAKIVTKNTSFKSIKNVKSIIGTYPNIKISLIPDKYLFSRKEFLCPYLNLEPDNTLILSTSDIYSIYLIMNGISINETLITISGNALSKGKVINTKIGVSLKEIINEYIEIIDKDYEVYVNGLLSGYKINLDNDLIITSDISYIVINKKEETLEYNCINCGACNKICPYNINVKKCYVNKLNNKKCIGCGLCNYICPANIDLKKVVWSGDNEEES